jgi:hypothetical protein
VIRFVDAAFAARARDATCVDAGQDKLTATRYVTCVVLFGTAEMVPERKVTITRSGRPVLLERDQAERNDLYTRILAATVLATAQEAFGSALAADEVRVLVVRPDPGTRSRVRHLGVVYAGRIGWDTPWDDADPVQLVLSAPGAQLLRRGVTREVVNLRVGGDDDLQDLLDDFTDAAV